MTRSSKVWQDDQGRRHDLLVGSQTDVRQLFGIEKEGQKEAVGEGDEERGGHRLTHHELALLGLLLHLIKP